MDDPDLIHLRDYIVSTEIGAFQTERGVDQRLRFDVTAELAQQVSGVDDHVDLILSYDVLTQAIATALADGRMNLLETLAERIAAEVLSHPRAARVRVTVEKLDRVPGALGVTISRNAARMAADAALHRPVVIYWGRDGAVPSGHAVVVPTMDAPKAVPTTATARRIALLSLDQAAWALAEQLNLTVADTRTELDWAAGDGRPVVWAPARMTADETALGADPLALTAWLAGRLNAERVEWRLPTSMHTPALPDGIAAVISLPDHD